MNSRFALLVAASMLFALGIAIPSVAATSCGTVPSSISSLTLYCIPVNVVNTQAIASNTGLQMVIPFNAKTYAAYLNGGVTNIYVYNGLSGTLTPSWIEGNSVNALQSTSINTITDLQIWINPESNTICASCSNNGMYWIGVGALGTNFLQAVAGNYIGEAPQLSANYGQYDNGNEVFTKYCGFEGTGLCSTQFTYQDSIESFTSNNGYSINAASASGYAWLYASVSSTPFITESLVTSYGSQTGGTRIGSSTTTSFFTTRQNPYNFESLQVTPGTMTGIWISSSNIGTYSYTSSVTSYTTNVFGSMWISTASEMTWQGTTTYSALDANVAYSSTQYAYYGVGSDSNGGTLTGDWLRVRLDPPDQVMVTITTGSITAVPSVATNLPATITYPNTFGITATCNSGDTCQVWQVSPAVQECSATTTCTYTTPILAVGTYTNYNGVDSSAGVSSGTQTLTVNKGTPSVSCTENGYATANGLVYNTLAANTIILCSVTSQYTQVVSANAFWNGVNVNGPGSSLTYNAQWNDANTVFLANTITSGNYLATSYQFNVNSMPFNVISVTGNTGFQYETSVQTFTYVVNISKVYSTANMVLTANNVNALWSNQSIIAVPQTFIFNYPIPLIGANALAYTFNAGLYVTTPLTNYGTMNSLTQNELWNYLPVANAIPVNALLGQNETVQLVINQVQSLSAANVVAADVQLGASSNTLTDIKISQYVYNAYAKSFIPTNFGLALPTIGNPLQVNGNQIVKLGFNGANVFRNVTFTPFNAFLESVVNCFTPGNTLGIQWQFYNTPSLGQDTTMNVLLQGSFTPSLNGYAGATANGTNAGLPNPANALQANTVFQTCIYPSWGNFYIQGQYQYNTTNSITSTFFYVNQNIYNGLSALEPQKLYLSTLTNPSSYNIYAINQSTQQPVATLVQVLLFIPNTGKSVLVNEFKTSVLSPGTTYLQVGSNYTLNAYSLSNGGLLGSVTLTAVSCSPSACSQTIPIGSENKNYLPNQIKNFTASCSNTPQASNVMLTGCSFASLSGASYTVNLNIVASNTTQTCFQTVTASSGSLACTSIHTNNTSYTWTLYVLLNGAPVELGSGVFGTSTLAYGTDGGIAALIITLTLSMGFGWFSKKASMFLIGAGIGLIGSAFMRFVTLMPEAIGGLLIFLGVAVFIVERLRPS